MEWAALAFFSVRLAFAEPLHFWVLEAASFWAFSFSTFPTSFPQFVVFLFHVKQCLACELRWRTNSVSRETNLGGKSSGRAVDVSRGTEPKFLTVSTSFTLLIDAAN